MLNVVAMLALSVQPWSANKAQAAHGGKGCQHRHQALGSAIQTNRLVIEATPRPADPPARHTQAPLAGDFRPGNGGGCPCLLRGQVH